MCRDTHIHTSPQPSHPGRGGCSSSTSHIRDASRCMAATGHSNPTCAALAARPSIGSGTSRHSICRSWEVVIRRRLPADWAGPATAGPAPASPADRCCAVGSVPAPPAHSSSSSAAGPGPSCRLAGAAAATPARAGSSSAAGTPAVCPAPGGSSAEAGAGCAVKRSGLAGAFGPSCCCTAACSEKMLRAWPGCRRSGAGTGRPACRGTCHASS